MITVKQLLTSCGLQTPHEQIKLVKHSSHDGRTIRQIVADGFFDMYQAEQDDKIQPFHKCEVILSFISVEGNQAEFYGAYRVKGCRPFLTSDFKGAPEYLLLSHKEPKVRIWYDLEEIREVEHLRGRLVAQWLGTRGWHQKKDLDVLELLPPGNVVRFPGYQDLILSWSELKDIVGTPRLHRDWKTALSASAGIYRIVDMKSGKIYIGAAYGAANLWQRFSEYAKTGHGGNKFLKGLDADNFQWSIVRTLSGSMSSKEVTTVERIEMRKHGSMAIGLNWHAENRILRGK